MVSLVILYMSGGAYGLQLSPNDRFFEKLFMAILIYSYEFFFTRNLLRESGRRNICSYFRFMGDVKSGVLTDYDDFTHTLCYFDYYLRIGFA